VSASTPFPYPTLFRSRRGRRPGVAGPPADARLASPDVHREDRPELADRPPLEARRLGPAGDRSEGPARDAAPDGPLLRAARERRQARAAAPRPGRGGGRRRPV